MRVNAAAAVGYMLAGFAVSVAAYGQPSRGLALTLVAIALLAGVLASHRPSGDRHV